MPKHSKTLAEDELEQLLPIPAKKKEKDEQTNSCFSSQQSLDNIDLANDERVNGTYKAVHDSN